MTYVFKRDKARKKLHNIFALSDDEQFTIMIWAIDALQSGREDEAKPYLTYPAEAATQKLTDKLYVYKWMLETLSNELLKTAKKRAGKRGRHRSLNCTQFATIATCYNVLRSLENAEEGMRPPHFTIIDSLFRLTQRQFEWQRGFLRHSQIYRSLFIYGGEHSKDYFQATYKVSATDLFFCGFAFYALCLASPGFRADVDLTNLDISNEIRAASLAIMAMPILDLRAEAARVRSAVSTAYQPSVLRDHPLVLFGPKRDIARAPLPTLLVQRVTSGLYYDLVKGPSRIWREIGARYEQYCLNLLSSTLPEARPGGSFKYIFGKQYDAPDIFLHDEEGAIQFAVECKAKKMSIAAKYSTNPLEDAKLGFSEIIKGIVQLWRFFSHCRRDPEIRKISPGAIGLLLTLDPWLEMSNYRSQVLTEAHKFADLLDGEIIAGDRRRVLFCSIDDLESTLEHASTASFRKAADASSDEKYQGWMLTSIHQSVTDDKARHNPYPFAISDLIPAWDKISAEVPRLSVDA